MNSRWLTAVDDERGALKIEFNSGLAFLHLTLKQPLAGMRAAHEHFPQVLAWLRRMGHDVVYAINPLSEDSVYRFHKYFGFAEVDRQNGAIIMARAC